MIPLIILVTLIMIAAILLIFGLAVTPHPAYVHFLAVFIAATLFAYCGMVTLANGVYEISPVSNTTVNVTINEATVKYSIRDGLMVSVLVSQSLSQVLGFMAFCCYAYLIIPIYILYQERMQEKESIAEQKTLGRF